MAQTLAKLCTISLLLSSALAHMELSWPYPLRSKHNPATPQNLIDYDMKSPLDADGSNFPCKSYENDTPLDTVTTYTAGSTYNMTVEGSSMHGGGSCQISLSYDNGKTFKVIKSIIGGCPEAMKYDFTVPSYAPAGKALFAWTWSNFMGNREFYMNCAAVQIASTKISHRQTTNFDDLPNVWVADLASVNSCRTDGPDGSMTPVYPDPGPDVEYGGEMSSSSPTTPGNCQVPAVKRAAGDPLSSSASIASQSQTGTFQPSFVFAPTTLVSSASSSILRSQSQSAIQPSFVFAPTTIVSSAATITPSSQSSASSASVNTLAILNGTSTSTNSTASFVSFVNSSISTISISSASTLTISPPTLSRTTFSTPTSSAMAMSLNASAASMSFLGQSTVTVTMDCPATITITLPSVNPATITPATVSPATQTTRAACTGTAAICPCAPGFSCMLVDPCEWQCLPMTGSPSTWSTSVSPTTFYSPTPISPTFVSPSFTIPTTSTSTTTTTISSTTSITWTTVPPLPAPTLGFADRNNLQAYLPCAHGTFICVDASTWYTCDQNVDGGWSYLYPRTVAAGMQCEPHLSPNEYASDPQQGYTEQGFYRDDQYTAA